MTATVLLRADEVRRLRLERCMSVLDLAQKIRCSASHLYDMEKGRKQPSPAMRGRIARALRVAPGRITSVVTDDVELRKTA